MTTDQRHLYKYWRAELDKPGSQPRNEVTVPVAGYWRADGARTKPSWPVAIWYDDDGTPHTKIGRIQNDGEDAMLSFLSEATWMRTVAVSHADYLIAIETGRWPSDGKHARHLDDAAKHDIDLSEGENAAPVEEALADQITSLADTIDKTPEPTTQDQANALSGLLDKMRVLLRLAEAERVKLKEPHLQAGREVDATWSAIKAPGEQAGISGEARRKAFLRKEQARLDAIAAEERRKATEAENARIKAENEARLAEAEKAGASDVEFVPEVQAPTAPVEAPRATAGSAFGRASGLKKVKVVDAIDYPVLTKHLLDVGDEDFRNYLMDRAKKATRAKVTLPGVSTKDELQ